MRADDLRSAWIRHRDRHLDFRSLRDIERIAHPEWAERLASRPPWPPSLLEDPVEYLILRGVLPPAARRFAFRIPWPAAPTWDEEGVRLGAAAGRGEPRAIFHHALHALTRPEYDKSGRLHLARDPRGILAAAFRLARHLPADHPLVRLAHALAILHLRRMPEEFLRIRGGARRALIERLERPDDAISDVPPALFAILPEPDDRVAVLRPISEGVRRHTRLARADLPALLWLSSMSGRGAVDLLRGAARDGCVEAMDMLARILESGEIVPRDDAEAARWRNRLTAAGAPQPEPAAPAPRHIHIDPFERGDLRLLAFSQDGATLAAAGDESVHLIDVPHPERTRLFALNRVLALSPDARLVATLSDREVIIVDLMRSAVALSQDIPMAWGSRVPHAEFDRTGRVIRFAVAPTDGESEPRTLLVALDEAGAGDPPEFGLEIHAVPAHLARCTIGGEPLVAPWSAASVDGKRFAASDGYCVKIWDVK